MCSVNVEESLLSLKGVKKIQVDLKNKSGNVVYNANVVDLALIEEKITSIGYNVNGKLANKNAYDKLELCCKKPKDN
jgi:copper chaperone CopZ